MRRELRDISGLGLESDDLTVEKVRGTPTPAPCGTPIANGVFVAMASYITATTDPTYGLINGYALVATDGTYSNVEDANATIGCAERSK